MTENMKALLFAPVGIVWIFASPITFILSIVDTWQGRASVPIKLLLNLTIDAFAAMLWPATWLFWAIMAALGYHTPLAIL